MSDYEHSGRDRERLIGPSHLGLTARSNASPRAPTGLHLTSASPRTPSGFGLSQTQPLKSSSSAHHSSHQHQQQPQHNWPVLTPEQINATYAATKKRRPWSRLKYFAKTRPIIFSLMVAVVAILAVWWLRSYIKLDGVEFGESGLSNAAVPVSGVSHVALDSEVHRAAEERRRRTPGLGHNRHLPTVRRPRDHAADHAAQVANSAPDAKPLPPHVGGAEQAPEVVVDPDTVADVKASGEADAAAAAAEAKEAGHRAAAEAAAKAAVLAEEARLAASAAEAAALASNPRRLDIGLDQTVEPLKCQWAHAAPRPECNWHWGPARGAESANSELHPREDLAIEGEGQWKQPADFYAFQASPFVSRDGTGVLVRIFQRDQCCVPPADLPVHPLSYFRVSVLGAAAAAADPVLALGGPPSAMGTGHRHRVHGNWNPEGEGGGWAMDVDLNGVVDEQRVIQTFVLLPEAGSYKLEVRLLLFNASLDMARENFERNSLDYEQRPGLWIDRPLQHDLGVVHHRRQATEDTVPPARKYGPRFRRFVIPELAAQEANKFVLDRQAMPVCGAEQPAGSIGSQTKEGSRLSEYPLAGRWVFQPPQEDQEWAGYKVGADPATLDPTYLLEQSVYVPYLCRLDWDVELPSLFDRLSWVHFVGDSNSKYLFMSSCEMAGGTLKEAPEAAVPKHLNPPRLCEGPTQGGTADPKWVLTWTSFFWGLEQTLNVDQEPGDDHKKFSFASQCKQWVEQNSSYTHRGWPACSQFVPPSLRDTLGDGPGATIFAWGSHAAELGANPSTEALLRGEEALGIQYFDKHPTLFPLTTAAIPSRIPDKFGKQQVMRNNERVHASNLHLMSALQSRRQSLATRSGGDNGRFAPVHATTDQDWVPLMDWFSPTHAAYEQLAVDAVHFKPFFGRLAPRLMAHYLRHAPAFLGKQ